MAITGLSGSTTYLQAIPGIGPYPNRTIAIWAKLAASATATNYLFNVTGPSNSYQCNLHTAGTPTPNSFGSVSQSLAGTTIDGSMTGNIVNPTNWHLLMALHDNGGTAGQVKTVSPYLDGVNVGAVTTGGPVTAMVDNDPGSTDFIFTGSVDGGATVAYAMLWKRLLTQAEITALWNGGAGADPRVVAPSALVIFAQLNSASGPITDLATPSIQWVKTGPGTFTVVADPFSLAPPSQPSGQPFPPAWERGAGAADPGLSLINGPYSGPQAAGSGYAANRGGTGKVGTINAGLGVALPPPAGFPAQVRWFVGADGQLHALTNQTGLDYAIPAGSNPQQPPYYSPTK